MAVYQLLSFDGFGYTIPVAFITAATQAEADAFCARQGKFFPNTKAFFLTDNLIDAAKPVQVTSVCPVCGQEYPGYVCPGCAVKIRKDIKQRGGLT